MSDALNKDSRVVIAGGGFAGLFATSVLLDKGVKNITLIEKITCFRRAVADMPVSGPNRRWSSI